MAGPGSVGRLSGFSSLIAFAMTARIQRSLNVHERTDWSVNLFNLVHAKFGEDKNFHDDLLKLFADFTYLRENYNDVLDYENWAVDDRNKFNLYLDHIELRLYKIINNSKIVDSAGLREMVVPE